MAQDQVGRKAPDHRQRVPDQLEPNPDRPGRNLQDQRELSQDLQENLLHPHHIRHQEVVKGVQEVDQVAAAEAMAVDQADHQGAADNLAKYTDEEIDTIVSGSYSSNHRHNLRTICRRCNKVW